MRSSCTSRPARSCRTWPTAPAVCRKSCGSATHSACHAPSARSCSCVAANERRDERDSEPRRGDRRHRVDRDCASAASSDEPPLPGFAPSDSSPTSVCARSATSPAILLIAPAATPSAAATVGDAIALGVPGQVGLRAARARSASNAATRGPASPSEASVPTAPPNCSGSVVGAERFERAHLARGEREPARRLEAEGDRRRLLQERTTGHQRVTVLLGERRGAVGDAAQLAHEQREAGAHLEHHRGVDRRPGSWRPSARSRAPSRRRAR